MVFVRIHIAVSVIFLRCLMSVLEGENAEWRREHWSSLSLFITHKTMISEMRHVQNRCFMMRRIIGGESQTVSETEGGGKVWVVDLAEEKADSHRLLKVNTGKGKITRKYMKPTNHERITQPVNIFRHSCILIFCFVQDKFQIFLQSKQLLKMLSNGKFVPSPVQSKAKHRPVALPLM